MEGNSPQRRDDSRATSGAETTALISPNSVRPSIKRSTRTKRGSVVPRSKAAGLILLWYFIVNLVYGVGLNPDVYVGIFRPVFHSNELNYVRIVIPCSYVGNAVLLIFYPLSGFLADVRFGRYKTVVRSIWMVFGAFLISIVGAGLALIGMPLYMIHSLPDWANTVGLIYIIDVACVFGIIAVILLFTGFTGFNANIVQFGVDQLHDTPVGDTSLFIHWYMILFYLSTTIVRFLWMSMFEPVIWLFTICVTTVGFFLFLIMPISLCLGYRKRHWFLIEPGQTNPYKLVYRVVKFAIKHKHPVYRSAFTYCEDELPSRIDLGKEKYGGPFSTEQVEDVKAFFGIFRVLIALGPFFAIKLHSSALIELVGFTKSYDFLSSVVNHWGLSPILAIVFIFVYILFLKPFISRRIPSMLKRIGLGMIILLISLLCTFSVNTAELVVHNEPICRAIDFSNTTLLSFDSQRVTGIMLVLINVLSALSNVLIYIATFEFICAQAPYSMKGLLIGSLFAIKGVFQLIGIGIGAPFLFIGASDHVVCGFGYYLILIILTVVSLAVYIWVAKRYRFRQRDEPSNVHRYVEEYYSNTQQK